MTRYNKPTFFGGVWTTTSCRGNKVCCPTCIARCTLCKTVRELQSFFLWWTPLSNEQKHQNLQSTDVLRKEKKLSGKFISFQSDPFSTARKKKTLNQAVLHTILQCGRPLGHGEQVCAISAEGRRSSREVVTSPSCSHHDHKTVSYMPLSVATHCD